MYYLPKLDYNYDSFGKYISKNIMELHHSKHHQAYIDKLNSALESQKNLTEISIEQLLSNLNALPEEIRTAVRNNGGGHYNHSLFWRFMDPSGGGEPSGELASQIKQKYTDFQKFTEDFEQKALSVFGSGWVWLQPDLNIITTPNQDSPIMSGQSAPILGLDVWEHAYYLDYTYRRADYVKAWWNVVNWQYVNERYSAMV